MAMNRIQFQPGLSMPVFLERYGTESQCEAALEHARWPSGFRCPRCDGAAYSHPIPHNSSAIPLPAEARPE